MSGIDSVNCLILRTELQIQKREEPETI